MEPTNLSYIELWILISAIIFGRYFVVAGIGYGYFYRWNKQQWSHRKIQKRYPGTRQVRREIVYSLSTLLMYTAGAWLFLDWLEKGLTLRYHEIQEFGWGYLILSFLIMLFLHDTYFYWTHRLMHHKALFRWTHQTHHSFTNPTPWCSFAFHPLEAFVSMGIIPIIVFCMPWHYYALLGFISFMTFYDVYIHLGFHLPGFRKLSSLQNTAALHDLHHSHVHGNYGLYFTLWDHLMGTYRPGPEAQKSRTPVTIS